MRSFSPSIGSKASNYENFQRLIRKTEKLLTVWKNIIEITAAVIEYKILVGQNNFDIILYVIVHEHSLKTFYYRSKYEYKEKMNPIDP